MERHESLSCSMSDLFTPSLYFAMSPAHFHNLRHHDYSALYFLKVIPTPKLRPSQTQGWWSWIESCIRGLDYFLRYPL